MVSGQTHITLPQALLAQIDIAAKELFMTRSEFIKQAVVDKLQDVQQWRAQLAAVAANNDVLTEAELLKMLQARKGQRESAEYWRAWRREMRARSLARKQHRPRADQSWM